MAGLVDNFPDIGDRSGRSSADMMVGERSDQVHLHIPVQNPHAVSA